VSQDIERTTFPLCVCGDAFIRHHIGELGYECEDCTCGCFTTGAAGEGGEKQKTMMYDEESARDEMLEDINNRVDAKRAKAACPTCNNERFLCSSTKQTWGECRCGNCERGPSTKIPCPQCSKEEAEGPRADKWSWVRDAIAPPPDDVCPVSPQELRDLAMKHCVDYAESQKLLTMARWLERGRV